MDLHQNDTNMFQNVRTKCLFVVLFLMEVCSKYDSSYSHKPFILLPTVSSLALLGRLQTPGKLQSSQ